MIRKYQRKKSTFAIIKRRGIALIRKTIYWKGGKRYIYNKL